MISKSPAVRPETGRSREVQIAQADFDEELQPKPDLPEHLGGEPTDHPAGEILRSGDRGCEMDGIQSVAAAEGVGGGRLRPRPVDDPDLDDAFRPGTFEQSTHLRSSDPESQRDGVLGLTQFVVEATRQDELLCVAHGPSARAQMF